MTTVDILANTQTPIHARLLINGDWLDGAHRMDVRNPARPDELVGTVVRGTPVDVDRAVAAAKAAQAGWAALGYRGRGAVISRCLDALEDNIDARAFLFVRENGKTLREARGELVGVTQRQRLTLELIDELEQDRQMDSPSGRTIITRRPYGVVVSIVPWNTPVGLAFMQIVPALLAGNTVVVKPPETCPLALIKTIELIAGILPPGALNVVTGMPSEIGDRLTTHPDVGKIGFTGSIPSARTIMANASKTIKSVTLELGGNDPAIVLDDADLGEDSMQRMANAVFRMTGQVCMAVKRIYVPQTMKDKFLDAFMKVADKVVVGDGLEPKVTMGPLHTEKGLIRANGLVEDAERRGATVMRLGKIDNTDIYKTGYFMQPTIITDVADDALVMSEEQFCPAIPITTYTDLNDALRRANATIHGLGGSVWGRDVERALAVARRVESGTVWVNAHGTEWINRRAPYGGVKQSGIGRRAGREGVEEYMQIQTLTALEHPPT